MTQVVAQLVEEVRRGERLALARLLTLVENDTAEGRAALNLLFPFSGRAHLIGVTGSPGTGKSTLVNQLVKGFRAAGVEKIGVLAIDPSSPFTGGALLGDRVRMRDLAGDSGVFIRSMASRGALGGLSHATASAALVMDAAGFDVILIETVGAGQSEVDVARLAHTVLVVEAPGLGDDIQAGKAGILEIADILIVNKCDLPGADRTASALRTMLEMAHPTKPGMMGVSAFWQPPVLLACATGCRPIGEIVEAVTKHKNYLLESGEWQRRDRERLQNDLTVMVRAALMQRLLDSTSPDKFQDILERLACRQLSPYEAVAALIG